MTEAFEALGEFYPPTNSASDRRQFRSMVEKQRLSASNDILKTVKPVLDYVQSLSDQIKTLQVSCQDIKAKAERHHVRLTPYVQKAQEHLDSFQENQKHFDEQLSVDI